jgi:prevent-host-death family protein
MYFNLSKIDKLIILDKLIIMMIMATISATEAKQKFAALIDTAQREPVRIQRHERDVAVLISAEEYDEMQKDRWVEFNRLMEVASEQAKANGFTEEDLKEILAER